MSRGQKLLNLCEPSCSGIPARIQHQKMLNEVVDKKKKKADKHEESGIPNYVNLFDAGNWEEFNNSILKANRQVDKTLEGKAKIKSIMRNEKQQVVSCPGSDTMALARELVREVGVTDEQEENPDGLGQNPLSLTRKTATPKTTPSRPVFDLPRLCNRTLFADFPDTNTHVQKSCAFSDTELESDGEKVPGTPSVSSLYDSDRDPEYQPSNDEGEDLVYSDDKNSSSSSVCDITEEIPLEEPSERQSNNSNSPSHRKRDFCVFCESSVLNFARHIITSHSNEIEVQKIKSMPPKSKERTFLISNIRKRGNYIYNTQEGCKKPVRAAVLPDTTHLPCSYCLGFYSKKQLWRHRSKCKLNPKNGLSTLGDSQTLLVNNSVKVDDKLKALVFPRMSADVISLAAKKDGLICAFGSRYLKSHKEKHHIHTTSNKMRELARLLINIRTVNPNIKNMFNALMPENYDLLVQATKTISSYDEEKETFSAPTLAMNIARSLKDCCDIAITDTLKKKTNQVNLTQSALIEELRTTKGLIEANWRYDISTEAASDLNIKKWNKITIVPLATDLKIFKEYLSKTSEKAALKLSKNADQKLYKALMESVFCQVLVLNRRRPGELQRVPLDSYVNGQTQSNYEEFSSAITPSEKILMQTFKRIVIRGKRGRGVPVLFPPAVQKHIDILLSAREKMCNEPPNPYLFGLPGYKTTLIGYKVLKKHAELSGMKNPKSITATRLRKHLATITQLFNMSANDIEQLTMFMGHTENVHRSVYRLPDDVYQTARLGKLLMAMSDGTAGNYKGKTLEEIDIEMEEDLLTAPSQDSESEGHEDEGIQPQIRPPSPPPRLKKNTRTLVPWTAQQKKLVLVHFKNHIRNSKPPKRAECEYLISKNKKVFANKNWLKIKVYVQNQYTKPK